MKTIIKIFIALFAFCLVGSCEKDLNNADSTKESLNHNLKGVPVEVVEWVKGSGHLSRDYGDIEDVWRTFSIDAVKYSDGSVVGTFQVNDHGIVSIQGNVICLTTDSNEAYVVTETVTYKSDGIVVAPYGRIKLVDNGNGKNADPDQITLLLPLGSPNYFCDTPIAEQDPEIEWPLFDIEAGNIKVGQN